jgi:hypothetical protein
MVKLVPGGAVKALHHITRSGGRKKGDSFVIFNLSFLKYLSSI